MFRKAFDQGDRLPDWYLEFLSMPKHPSDGYPARIYSEACIDCEAKMEEGYGSVSAIVGAQVFKYFQGPPVRIVT